MCMHINEFPRMRANDVSVSHEGAMGMDTRTCEGGGTATMARLAISVKVALGGFIPARADLRLKTVLDGMIPSTIISNL